MYREEFRRQEIQESLSFREFLQSLDLTVDARPLDASDIKRASQLTLRTNQFNFTTKRRDEGEMRALLDNGHHVIRTIRVRDRFGDYGLVGLVIAINEGSDLQARHDRRKESNIVHWRKGGYAYALVGKIDPQTLQSLADDAWHALDTI